MAKVTRRRAPWPCLPPVSRAVPVSRNGRTARRRSEEMVTVMIRNNGWAWWQGGLMWLAMIAFWPSSPG